MGIFFEDIKTIRSRPTRYWKDMEKSWYRWCVGPIRRDEWIQVEDRINNARDTVRLSGKLLPLLCGDIDWDVALLRQSAIVMLTTICDYLINTSCRTIPMRYTFESIRKKSTREPFPRQYFVYARTKIETILFQIASNDRDASNLRLLFVALFF